MQWWAKSRIVVAGMPATFEPRLDILPESQRRLWPELDAVHPNLFSTVEPVSHFNSGTASPRISIFSHTQVSMRIAYDRGSLSFEIWTHQTPTSGYIANAITWKHS